MYYFVFFVLGVIGYFILQWPIPQALIALILIAGFVVFYFLLNALVYRIFIFFFPLELGYIPHKSRMERIYHIHVLYYLMCFYPYMRSNLLPTPLARLFLIALGAKVGENTYPQGLMPDAIFISIGSYCVIGADSKIIPHALEGTEISHAPIRLGDRVTLGVNSVVFAGSTIGDDAIVAAGAIVLKNTNIGPGEIWAGIPAKKIGERSIQKV